MLPTGEAASKGLANKEAKEKASSFCKTKLYRNGVIAKDNIALPLCATFIC